jgi:hypothetical protein
VVAVLADPGELGHLRGVHEDLRVGQPQAQQRDERLPARQDLGVVTTLTECGDDLVDRAGTHVVELRRDHADSPPAVVSVLAPP